MTRVYTLLLTLLLVANSKAQTPVPVADTTFKEISLNEVVIAANRFPENKKYVAQQVQVLSAQKIQSFNQPTTAELLTHSGNVLVQKSQLGGGSPIIRGFEANKVLIVVDGVRMNNAIFRGGHLQNVITMDNAALERAEILFGPSSVMYGSDALGGVMSFTTKKPVYATDKKNEFTGNAFVRYSSAYNEKTGHVDFNIAGKGIASFTSFTFSDFGDLVQGGSYYSQFPNWGKRTFYVERINNRDSMINNSNPQKQVQTGYSQYDLLQKFKFNIGKIENTLNIQYSSSSDIYRYDRLTETDGAGKAKNAQWYYGPQKRLLVAWHLNLPKTNIYDRAQITAAWQDIGESRHNRGFNKTKLTHRIEKVGVFSFNADFKKALNKSEFNYGAELMYNKVNSSAYSDDIVSHQSGTADSRYPDGGSNTRSIALYGTLSNKFSEYFILTSGLRLSTNHLFSKFTDKTFFPFPYNDITQNSTSLTGNVGFIFLPDDSWKLSAMISSGFRTPNVDDMTKVFESGDGTLIVPNPDIKPEKTTNFELGIAKKIANKFLVEAAVWYTDYTNALTTDFSTFNGSSTVTFDGTESRVVTVVNKAKASIWGLSGNITGEITEHLHFSTAINYTYGRIKETPTNYPLDHVAPLFGKTSLSYHAGKFTGEIFALYNGAKDSLNYNLRGEDNQIYSADPVRGFTPGWFTANIRTAYEINKHVAIQLAVENVTDKFYRVFASGLSAPGRNFVLTLRAKL